jgi:hypothetical protein
MACDVAVIGVIGVTVGGKLDHIVVFGTATNCDLVEVTVECGLRKLATAKVQGGAWATSFPAVEAGCECNATIMVSVECISRQCREGPTAYTLICQEQTNCPLVTGKLPKISDCNKDGTRTVTFFYQFVPQGTPVGAKLLVDGVVKDAAAPTTTTYVLSYTTTLAPGSHTVAYIFDPPNCGGQTTPFDVDPCPLPGGCPKIVFEEPRFESECRDGSRSVRVTAKVEPQGNAVDAKLVGAGGVVLDSATGQWAPFTLSGVQNLPSGTTTVSIDVTAPQGCPGKSLTVEVNCPGQPPPPPPPPPSDDSDGGGGCFFGRVAIVLLFATALFLLLIGICLALPYALVAAAVAFVVAAIVFALWWAFCGSKCAALLLWWQVSAIGAIVAGFLAGCCALATIFAIVLAVAALAGFFGWIQACRPSACKVLFELIWVFVTPVPLILKPLAVIAPCGIPAVPTWVGLVAAALAVAWGAAGCAKKI